MKKHIALEKLHCGVPYMSVVCIISYMLENLQEKRVTVREGIRLQSMNNSEFKN